MKFSWSRQYKMALGLLFVGSLFLLFAFFFAHQLVFLTGFVLNIAGCVLLIRIILVKPHEQEEELKNKAVEFDRMNQLMIGRELKMIEFKHELRELRNKLGITQAQTSPEQALVDFENSHMNFEETKKAMLNLLEDERALEEQLKVEKTSVEQKVVERTKELSDERSKLSASINSLSVGFVMVDRDYNIITINHMARQLFCASASSPFATIKECNFAHIEEQLKTALNLRAFVGQCFDQKKAILIKEIKFKERFLKVFITPIITIGVIGAVVLTEDITEAKIMERSKDEFFSIASHELRTPLTAIRGNTSMIQQFFGDKITDPELLAMIKDINESTVRLIAIVNDFLDTSRLEMGKMLFTKEVFDIVKLVNDTIKEFATESSQKNLYLRIVNPPSSAIYVLADPNKTKQVLINLISNAIKFTEKGGISLAITAQDATIKITITDTGRGISPESQTLLFRKFQQAQDSILTRDTTKGTGLGLYISKLIMVGMNGKITIDSSEVGKGTTFSITLPAAPANTNPQSVIVQSHPTQPVLQNSIRSTSVAATSQPQS
ncbi:MAG TPA: PAS domain-containing sensor histidine kinase [Patescibacteria group bacterium]|nr:PAS domain-containing sensor histidine kinase [Patescibacteria group bacterium]